MARRQVVILAGAILVACTVNAGMPAADSAQATVPLLLDHNRMTVAVALQAAGRASQMARAWIDTGGTNVVLAESLARSLGNTRLP